MYKLNILNIDKRHLSKKINKQHDQHVKQETLLSGNFPLFGAKILTKICAKPSQTLCPAISKMSSKTMVITLNVSNDEKLI